MSIQITFEPAHLNAISFALQQQIVAAQDVLQVIKQQLPAANPPPDEGKEGESV